MDSLSTQRSATRWGSSASAKCRRVTFRFMRTCPRICGLSQGSRWRVNRVTATRSGRIFAMLQTVKTNLDNQVQDSQVFRYRIIEMEDRYRKQALAMACTLVSLVDLRDSYTGGH